MRLLYLGPFWPGSTALHRLEAFRRIPNLDVVALDTNSEALNARSLRYRVSSKLGWPLDMARDNERLVDMGRRCRPDVVFVESKVLRMRTLRGLHEAGVRCLAYYTPDDIIARHNITWPLKLSFPEWDLFFTTKSFNVGELADRQVRRPILVGNSYAPDIHRPMSAAEVGSDFERYDFVFIGTYERERCCSINRLVEAGFSVIVYGYGWERAPRSKGVVVRPGALNHEYTRCMHHGRVALCFLRKINRDLITTRSVEIPAMARPMLAERSAEHDEHFRDGSEYVGFSNDDELVERAKALLSADSACATIAKAGRERCILSGYSTDDRARFMLEAISENLGQSRRDGDAH